MAVAEAALPQQELAMRRRHVAHLVVTATAITAMVLAQTLSAADPLTGTDRYPEIVFLARNDVPFDAQTAASMAAQLGAPVFITNPNVLSEATRNSINAINPEVIVVAGGVTAISEEVAEQAAATCNPDCVIDRYAGSGRDETAAALARIAEEYGFERPVLQGSKQVLGDVHVGGALHTDSLAVQDTDLVSGLNADRVDGKHADDFVQASGTHTITVVTAQAPPSPPFSSLGEVYNRGYGTGLYATGTGPGGATLSAPVPSTLFGRSTASLVSAEYCYDATDAGTTLTEAWLIVGEANPGSPGGTAPVFVHVETERTDAACRTLRLDSPYQLDGDETASVHLNVDFADAGDQLLIGRATFHFDVD